MSFLARPETCGLKKVRGLEKNVHLGSTALTA